MSTGKNWYKGHIGRFWDTSYRDFNYVRQPITQEEVDQWVSKGYDYVKSFTGEMYDNRNPMPDWTEQLKGLFDFKNLTFTFYKMNTLEIMPAHSDHFNTYMKITGAKYENVYRILLMLEDWKPGHYLEIDGTGIVNWLAGDYFIWENSTPHAASNIGTDPRYTLQITGEAIQGTDVWRKLHWFNIPKLRTKRESEVEPFMSHIISKCFYYNMDPTFIYMYNQHIEELDSINHDEQTIEYLNEKGVHFYLYEPLCSYLEDAPQLHPPFGTKHTRWFYSEFPDNIKYDDLRADELDSILDYINRNGLTDVTVHTCDYFVEKYYPHYSSKMKLLGDDLYIKTALPITVNDTEFQDKFTKKFISANWRYTPHRHLIAAVVSPIDSYVSWYYKGEFFTIADAPWYNFHDWKEKEDHLYAFNKMIVGIQHLNRNGPINIDLKIKESILIRENNYFVSHFPADVLYDHKKETIDGANNALEEYYKDIFCDIVTESRFAQPTANYSEKVYQPMWYKKPFVLVAPPKTLQVLKNAGFKTFSEFWDESYDDEESHQERIIKIFKVIDFINDKPIEELRKMFDSMKPILQHNYNLLCNLLGETS
jgi:hypothetical protein